MQFKKAVEEYKEGHTKTRMEEIVIFGEGKKGKRKRRGKCGGMEKGEGRRGVFIGE